MTDVSSSDDIIDSRDVIERIKELESEKEDLEGNIESLREELHDARLAHGDSDEGLPVIEEIESRLSDAEDALGNFEHDELKALQDLESEADGYTDWKHGATLIRDSHFEDYARELAEELHGDAIGRASWPFDCIDWKQAATDLQMDYTSVEFDSVTYWVR